MQIVETGTHLVADKGDHSSWRFGSCQHRLSCARAHYGQHELHNRVETHYDVNRQKVPETQQFKETTVLTMPTAFHMFCSINF